MERNLYGFLHPEEAGEKEVIISKRFKDENGEPMPFVIKPLTQEVCDTIQKSCIKTDKKGNSTFDRIRYVNETTAAAVVFPDLKSTELQKAYGVLGEVSLLKKMLYTVEYNQLVEEVQELSGMDEDLDEMKEEIKNA